MSTRRLNKCIFKRVLEIFILVILVIISYNSFTTSKFASYAQISEAHEASNRDLQILYDRSFNDQYEILSTADILDSGNLNIYNPNEHVVTSSIVMKIKSDTILDISLINVSINGKMMSHDDYTLVDEYYILPIEKREINSKESINYIIKIYGNALHIDTNLLTYDFDITQSFYY